jgi:hypothetical protein
VSNILAMLFHIILAIDNSCDAVSNILAMLCWSCSGKFRWANSSNLEMVDIFAIWCPIILVMWWEIPLGILVKFGDGKYPRHATLNIISMGIKYVGTNENVLEVLSRPTFAKKVLAIAYGDLD